MISKHPVLKSSWYIVLPWPVLLSMQITPLNLLCFICNILAHFKINNLKKKKSWRQVYFKSLHIASFPFPTERHKCSIYKCDSIYRIQSSSKHKTVIQNNWLSRENGKIKKKNAEPCGAEAEHEWDAVKLDLSEKSVLSSALHQPQPSSKIPQMATWPLPKAHSQKATPFCGHGSIGHCGISV